MKIYLIIAQMVLFLTLQMVPAINVQALVKPVLGMIIAQNVIHNIN